MAKRYLLARGHRTALRYLLPELGSVSIGAAHSADVRLEEPGVRPEHAVLHLDFDGAGLELNQEAEATVDEESARGPETVELNETSVFVLGAVELRVAPAGPDCTGPHAVEGGEATEASAPDSSSGHLKDEIEALEKKRILEALEEHQTQAGAAKALGIPLRTFTNRMDALGIPRARNKKR